ncbi:MULTISPECIES: pyridoxamine 5'-phosphate oxidase [Sphingobium]|uniref:Pyridoxamine 5'-phosphate oxidase n=1 Tax=Sphingobium chungbukense TaxID=56193 RepID=A0A0M3ART3_9SPHN|nr:MULTISPECIES: pyridoxamine 5'-phosphate oxidase [Sphingobium]KKW91631.1 pyridoxamine 5'-phosphate oxidase [Sphingobium chungbukense]PJG46540.1 pyridoxamine 5'-phosphate oxidase [Sphingobium sp. LB126]
MMLDDTIVAFLHRPLMCILAGSDASGRPAAGRGIGVMVSDDRETLGIILSAWHYSALANAVAQTGKLAATFVSPCDYVTYQFKGRTHLREAGPADLARAETFIADATASLSALGVPRGIIPQWMTTRDARVAMLAVAECYVQTPGPHAGMRADAANGAPTL